VSGTAAYSTTHNYGVPLHHNDNTKAITNTETM
jgi:hypothetical protein